MVRADAETRLKCGAELLVGQQYEGAVVTREVSDWSIVPLSDPPEWLWISVERSGGTVEVSYSRDGENWTMFRQATLTDADPILVGVMGAAPQGDGFEARFEQFSVE
jgi:regulation of enolase protein 1 (concanavalin A-like superfamily)